MTIVQQQSSPRSDDDQRHAKLDDKKRKRMLSNRESARRSRMRKQQHVEELTSQVSELQNQNKLIMQKISEAEYMFSGIELENNVLRAQISELTDRLYSLSSLLHLAKEVSGFTLDIPGLPDTLLEPWQIPYPVQLVMSSTNMSHC